MGDHKRGQGRFPQLSQPAVAGETVIPNPKLKLKLLDQVRGKRHHGVVFCPLRQRLIYEHVVLWRAKAASPLTAAFLDGLPRTTADGTAR
jgi:hypothetical protein